MSLPSALDGIVIQLTKRGLPIDYAERAGIELADHYRDLVSEQRAAGLDETAAVIEAARRLGDLRTLIKKTVREYQRRRWTGRWPLVTFVLAPIPMLCLVWLTMAAVLAGVGSLCDWLGYELTQADGKTSLFERCVVEGMWGFTFLLGPMLVIGLFARLAGRGGLALSWGVFVGVQMALFVGLTQFNVDYQRCTLQVGLPIDMPSLSGWINWYIGGTWRHLLQVVVPLALGLLIFASQVASRRRAANIVAC
jgi:hypothetical protein